MRRFWPLLLAVVLLLCGGLGSSTAAQVQLTGCDIAPGEEKPDQEEQHLLDTINRYRLPADRYVWNDTLGRAAIWMAHDLANNNRFSHTDSLNRGLADRLHACGYDFQRAGENVSGGTAYIFGDDYTLSDWLFSDEHRDLIVKPGYTQAGIGRAYGPYSTYKFYWVLVAGVPAATPSPTPVPLTSTPTPVPPTATPSPAWRCIGLLGQDSAYSYYRLCEPVP